MPETNGLEVLGFGPRWEALFQPYREDGLAPARVIRSVRGHALLAMESGIVDAKPSPRLVKASTGPADLPAAGDWVAVAGPGDSEPPLIEAILHRSSAIMRGDPSGTSEVQVLAANIDIAFVVHPIAEPPNLRRIERELSLAWDSGATPIMVLTKVDLSADPDAARAAVESVALGVDIIITNAKATEGAQALLPHMTGHRTAVLLGPSGAGKSTLVNTLLGEERQATLEVRLNDGRGRHTTVTRELIQMPGGGVLIDSPGLRAIGMTGSELGISSVFPDVEEIAASCKFRDCTHVDEPGCAVRAAVDEGALAAERLASYQKLIREAQEAVAKSDARIQAGERGGKRKIIAKASKEYFKRYGRMQK